MSPDVHPRFKTAPRRKPTKMSRDRTEMRELRRALLERSRGRCEAGFVLGCTGVGVHAHHIRRRSQGGTNDLANLLWVCEPDHVAIHANPAAAMERGFLKPGWDQ